MRVSVIGLGKLGSPLAACLAARGHQVVGVDVNARHVQAIREGRPPVAEPGLAELLRESAGRLTARRDIAGAVRESELTFILVPTPSRAGGGFSLRYVLRAARAVGRALRSKDEFHVVVVTSTVMPGDCGGTILPALEQASGKRCGRDFGLCYQPEFVALGSVIANLRQPDFILIGESDPASGERLSAVVRSLCDHAPPVERMALVNAEVAKLAVNTFVTMKISFANLLGELCERLPGGDADVVTRAVGLDRRIGGKYLQAGLSYGGPCFPRDNRALASLARRLAVPALLPRATDQLNRHQLRRLHHLVRQHCPPDGRIGILGLAYKPDTPVTEQAPGRELARLLRAEGRPVVAYDPLVPRAPDLLDGLRWAESVQACADQVDVLVLCTPCPEFAVLNDYRLGPRDFRQFTIIDGWRLLDPRRLAREIHYVALGRHRPAAAGALSLPVKARK